MKGGGASEMAYCSYRNILYSWFKTKEGAGV
jgi:hypothetical protein